jgi:hypothetical protein
LQVNNVSNKLSPSQTSANDKQETFKGGYQIFDGNILVESYSILACPQCFQVGDLELSQTKKQGLSMQLTLMCTNCEFSHVFWTSKKPKSVRSFDIDKRIIYAIRRLGKGYAGIQKFLVLMNLPPGMTKSNYFKIVKKISKAVGNVTTNVMKDAADEIKTLNRSATGTAAEHSNVIDFRF